MNAEVVFRREYGRCVATLIRSLGDIDAAEEAVQDAFAVVIQLRPCTAPEAAYELEAGATVPPLMFDTDEAVATLLALRDWAGNADPGIAEGALSALDKLSRVVPSRLRPIVQAL
jgi:predicted DNA-binding transcriptional regulator YafY